MSRGSELVRDWADGTYSFRVRLKELRQIQEACDAGPAVIASRLLQGEWRVNDVYEVIRLGLIGGGMEPIPAKKLVDEYWEPIRPNIETAYEILRYVIEGPEDEALPKAPAVKEEETHPPLSQTRNSDLPPSTSGEQSSE